MNIQELLYCVLLYTYYFASVHTSYRIRCFSILMENRELPTFLEKLFLYVVSMFIGPFEFPFVIANMIYSKFLKS